ncbi:MAG: hypothetical protein OEZ65_11305 [Gemmatimonadota bacterium]|nr:hypothetical protein [Gemmatimonadota bacterium]MDH5760166.1 hypothetical protein [Gemmatimonadota bacterium]
MPELFTSPDRPGSAPAAVSHAREPVYTRCLICAGPFPENQELEHLPRGSRFAFDPDRGRLWIICRACARWSLVPMEDRWEALEELERRVRDRGRLLSSTDNIALFRSGPLEVVRVGEARRAEEAWWRYGKELTQRKQAAHALRVAGAVGTGAVVLGGWATGGMSLFVTWGILRRAPDSLVNVARWARFGRSAWSGEARCGRCGAAIRSLRYRDRAGLIVLPGEDGRDLDLALRCPRCGRQAGDGGIRLGGEEAGRTLRRVLAYHHFAGASQRRVMSATRLIEEAGSARDLSRLVIRDGRRLGDLQRTGAIALEIAANESLEQHLLELELAELEAHWRREEELASIVDGELTPLPLMDALVRRVRGR